ncbi:hypothetical protein [Chengkuizengella sediminis]|uniref:hypothetical protein n=1 Tax=Chengkuizengella sediminis TaxID=1885917 RepID=UPI001389F197|nr:hypothetical protein [Chengkuizengella sediminis]NDI35103.1 hypothetical protein [Chengkuizengella sediminis]
MPNKEDIDRAKKIVRQELKKIKPEAFSNEIEKFANDVLETCYSIGGSYDEYTIREVAKKILSEIHKD